MKIEDLKNRTVYRLANDVENVDRDRRKSTRSLEGVEKWEKGQLVYVLRDTWTNRRNPEGVWRLSFQHFYGDITPFGHSREDVFSLLVAALEQVRTLDSVLYGARCGISMTSAHDVLANLLEDGEISLIAIEGAVAALEAREQADRDAKHSEVKPDGQ